MLILLFLNKKKCFGVFHNLIKCVYGLEAFCHLLILM